MRKKILFIVPSRRNGGTNSSLSCIFNFLHDRYDFQVLTISTDGDARYHFLEKSFTPKLLVLYYGDFRTLSLLDKVLAIVIKLLKRIALMINLDFESFLLKMVSSIVEKKIQPDIIIGFQENLSTHFASFFKNPNKIAWVHCDYDRAVPKGTDELPIYSRFRNIIAVSKFTYEKFIKRYPSLSLSTKYIYNLLDVNRIESLSKEKVDDELFKSGVFTIISVGRMDPVKQFSIIPQIAQKLVSRGLSFRWYILGGPRNEEYKSVVQSIKDCGVEEYVFALGNKSNPYPYFLSSDLYVSTSSSEACPMVFIEARMCGIPIISTDFGSAYEFIKDGVDGKIEAIENLHIAIATLIADKSKYSVLKQNSKLCKNINDDIIIKLVELIENN